MNTSPVIRRFRGCFIGGPLHGADLPGFIPDGGMLRTQVEVRPGELEAVAYRHRRLVDDGTGESLELLVFDGLPDADAAGLVDAERERRGGWGEPVLTLPAHGFQYRPEGVRMVAGFRDDGSQEEPGLGYAYVTRLSPDGAAVCAFIGDESRPISRAEVDASRCGWCDSGIGHTIEEHRTRVAATTAEERAMAVAGIRPTIDDLPLCELGLAVAVGLYAPHPDVLAVEEMLQELRERAIEGAHRQFLERRQAELEPGQGEALALAVHGEADLSALGVPATVEGPGLIELAGESYSRRPR